MTATSFPAFQAPWWLRSAHAQSSWSTLFRRPEPPAWRWETLELDDGDFLELCWLSPAVESLGATVIVLHGLEGGVDSTYVTGVSQQLAKRGFEVLVMHFRGCGRSLNRLPRAYHSGDTEDLAQVLAHLRANRPHNKILAAGYSLGGNVLLKFLGTRNKPECIQAAVAVSVPQAGTNHIF